MELEWERQQAPCTLSLEQICDLLSGSGLEPVRADLIKEGLANTNYRLEDSRGRNYHLRLAQRAPANLTTEVAVMREMAKWLPVPTVLFMSEARNLFVSEWAPGASLQNSDSSAILAVGQQLGGFLASLAGRRFPQAGFLNGSLHVYEPWPNVYDGLRGFFDHVSGTANCLRRSPDGVLKRLHECWDRLELQLRAATAYACLSHADFKPSNILCDQGRVSAVLDWEFAHAGTWLLDAGQLLRYQGDRRQALIGLVTHGLTAKNLEPPATWPVLATLIDTASLCDFLSREQIAERQLTTIGALLIDELELVESAEANLGA